MKITILHVLCGSDQPLPTHSLMRLLFIACVFVCSSYAQADSLTGAIEKVAYSPTLGSMTLFVFGLCSLVIVRRRKPWVASAIK